jgi:hypothetical protein
VIRVSAADRDDPRWVLAAWERGLGEGPLDRAVTLLSAVTGLLPEEAGGVELGVRDSVLAATLATLAGDTVWCSVRCDGCGDLLDLPIRPAAFSPPSQPDRSTVEMDGFVFRLPTTDDLRLLARADDPEAGRWLLLSSCALDQPAGSELTEELAAAVEEAMEQASPGAMVTATVGCPGCGVATGAALDLPALLWAEVRVRAAVLLHEVHRLATAYGWTEAAVLGLTPARRAAYLSMVDA